MWNFSKSPYRKCLVMEKYDLFFKFIQNVNNWIANITPLMHKPHIVCMSHFKHCLGTWSKHKEKQWDSSSPILLKLKVNNQLLQLPKTPFSFPTRSDKAIGFKLSSCSCHQPRDVCISEMICYVEIMRYGVLNTQFLSFRGIELCKT